MALDSTVKVKFLGDAANLAREAARASKATDQVGRSAESAHKHLSNMAKGFIAGASITAAAVGIEKAIRGTVDAYKEAAGQASMLSRLTGLAAEDASRLGFAAHETGTDMDVFAKALGILSKNLNGADKAQTVLTKTHHLAIEQVPRLVKGHIQYVAQLRNVTDTQKTTAAGTQSLGFALRDATGHLLPMAELLPKIADKFKNMADGPEKTALALKLFGRGGAALLPFLNQGAAGLAKFGEEADKLGITMTGKDVAAYRAYIAAQRSFKAAIDGVKISLGRELFPVFASWTKALADNGPMLAGYARELGLKIGPAAQRASDAIKSLARGFADGTGSGGQIRDTLVAVGHAVRDVGALLNRTLLPAMRWFAAHPRMMEAAIVGMVGFKTAVAAAEIKTALLGTTIVAVEGEAVTAGATMGVAFTAMLGPIGLVAVALAGVYGIYKMISDAPAAQKKFEKNFADIEDLRKIGAITDKQAVELVKQAGIHPDQFKLPDRPTHKPNTPDDYGQKAGRGKATVAASAAADDAKATKDAAKKTADASKAALDQELATAAAAQKVADAKAAAADALQKASDKLRDALQSRLDTAKGIRDSLVSSNSIVRDGVSWTAKDLLARFTVTMAKVKRFQAAISALVHKGYDQSIIDQVAAAGVQGGMGTAVGLAHASAAQVAQANRIQRQIEKSAGATGNRVASQIPIKIDAKLLIGNRELQLMASEVRAQNQRDAADGFRLAS